MKKILVASLFASIIGVANAAPNTIDMTNLKCGDLQIYSNTTLQQVKSSCKLKKIGDYTVENDRNMPDKYFDGKEKMLEVQFYSTSQDGLIRCDFNGSTDSATIIGCRNNY